MKFLVEEFTKLTLPSKIVCIGLPLLAIILYIVEGVPPV